ncbi:MAG: L-2-amino-thiazoline-4-carboxylic acid hydrolase [Candidatus Binatia bacterium]
MPAKGEQIYTLFRKRRTIMADVTLLVASAGDAHDITVLKQTSDAFEFNVTRSCYAQFYQELNEPELGFLLVCSGDYPLTEGLSPDLNQNTKGSYTLSPVVSFLRPTINHRAHAAKPGKPGSQGTSV